MKQPRACSTGLLAAGTLAGWGVGSLPCATGFGGEDPAGQKRNEPNAAPVEYRLPWAPEATPFICGHLHIPELPPIHQNRGVIRDQVQAGVTHMEGIFYWRLLEPRKDVWDFSSLEAARREAAPKGLKIMAFPWLQYAPEWFKKSGDYVPLRELGTGRTVDLLSPWAPGTLKAVEHFYAGLKRHAGDAVDMISIGSPSSDYGEIGLLLAAPEFADSKGPLRHVWAAFPQHPESWHQGLWCGDPFAIAHFRQWSLQRHGSLEKLNAAWKTAFADAQAIAFPDPAKRGENRRRWIDFMLWYEASQVELSENVVRIVRRHFPRTVLEAKLGFGDDNPRPALDRTAVCRALAKYPPFLIRSTHAAVNREEHARAYWFYKRMAPVCRRFGAPFGTEPPGGDLKVGELRRQMFEDASAGSAYLFSYFQNYKLLPDTVANFKRWLRPSEAPRVDIGVLYPTSQMLLDMAGFPAGQIPFCAMARDCLDYDVVDENMIGWGMLDSYRALVHTGGRVLEAGSLERLDQWVRAGGVLILRAGEPLESVEGDGRVFAAWMAKPAGLSKEGAVSRSVDRGSVISVTAAGPGPHVKAVVAALKGSGRKLEGFDGEADGVYTTYFPSRILRFTVATGAIEELPATRRSESGPRQ